MNTRLIVTIPAGRLSQGISIQPNANVTFNVSDQTPFVVTNIVLSSSRILTRQEVNFLKSLDIRVAVKLNAYDIDGVGLDANCLVADGSSRLAYAVRV